MKFYLVILFSFLYTNFSWCQKRNIPLHTFKSYLHQESLGIDSSNKVVSIPTMEDEELPILFRKIGLNKKILELSFITCWMKNPDCWPVKDLTIFCARKTQTGILFDKITLFALTPLNGDSVLFFLQKPSSNFYRKNVNKLISIKVDFNRYDFIYFDSLEYSLTELDLRSMRRKVKGFNKK